MRRAAILVLALVIGAPHLPGFGRCGLFAADRESLEQLKARAAAASPKDQPKLYLEIANLQLKAADDAYSAGDVDKGRTAVDEVAGYSEKASQAAISARKHLKNVEIKVRDMEHHLSDIRKTLNFEDRPPVEAAIERMEKARADLIRAMFGPNT